LLMLAAVLFITATATFLYGRKIHAGKVPPPRTRTCSLRRVAAFDLARRRTAPPGRPGRPTRYSTGKDAVMPERRSQGWYAGPDPRNNYSAPDAPRGTGPCVRRPPADRHRQHRLRLDAVQRPFRRGRHQRQTGMYEAGGIR
jgi:hypothetical protein